MFNPQVKTYEAASPRTHLQASSSRASPPIYLRSQSQGSHDLSGEAIKALRDGNVIVDALVRRARDTAPSAAAEPRTCFERRRMNHRILEQYEVREVPCPPVAASTPAPKEQAGLCPKRVEQPGIFDSYPLPSEWSGTEPCEEPPKKGWCVVL
jgi:hypothetical protein